MRIFGAASRSLRLAVAVLVGRALLGAAAALVAGATIQSALNGAGTAAQVTVLAVLLGARGLLAGLTPPLAAAIASSTEADLRLRIVDAMLAIDPSAERRTGEVVSKATEGIDAVGALGGTFLPQLFGGMLIPVTLIGIVAVVDWPTALVLLVLIPIVPVLLRVLEKRFASVSARYRRTADELSARFLDGIQGLTTLKALDRADHYGDRLADESERLRVETMSLLRVNQLALLAVDSLFTLATVVAAAAMAALRLSSGAIGVGEAVAIILLGVMLIEPLTAIGRFFYVGAIGRAAAAQVRELLAIAGDGEAGRRPADGLEPGAVEVDGVTFSYPDGPEALHDVTLRVAPGERVALVGPSGAGKTTLAHVILGMLEPERGRVGVGGRAVLVSQRPFLFHGTIADNLLLARPDAEERDLWEALEAAQLADEISRRDAGLDTPIGDRGLRLSGGEAQRLAIARALLVDADVVVLDEPTSNVDLETEARIQQALERLVAGRTQIVIAHRHSTIAGADRVVRLEGGRVVPVGSERGRP